MPKKLLLADDSITIQKVVGITFAQEDFDITYVDNGVDAINKAKAIKPDIVLADIVMPQKNGYDVCEAVKKDAELRHIPVLLLAGTFETFDVNRGKLVGADDYIIKPFESQALIDKVNSLLDKKPTAATPAGKPHAPSMAAAPTSKPSASMAAPPLQPPPPPPPPVFTEPGADELGGFNLENSEVTVTETFASAAKPLEDADLGSDFQDEPLPMASAAEMLLDSAPQAQPSASVDGLDLPNAGVDEFGLGASFDESSATVSNEANSWGTSDGATALDLPPLPETESSDFGNLDAAADPRLDQAPATVGSSIAAPPIDEAHVRQLVEARVQEVLEKVAWEVIPDLAERMIQEEIQRLTATLTSK